VASKPVAGIKFYCAGEGLSQTCGASLAREGQLLLPTRCCRSDFQACRRKAAIGEPTKGIQRPLAALSGLPTSVMQSELRARIYSGAQQEWRTNSLSYPTHTQICIEVTIILRYLRSLYRKRLKSVGSERH
jgi:hypothetical protein